jgi:hypothetical protein
MTDEAPSELTMHDALVEMQKAWKRLMNTMEREPKAAYSEKRDAVGWSALDHLAHVTAWERSRITWLEGRPRFEGLGVSSEEFKLDYDDLNELVRQQTAGKGYDELMQEARRVHQAMVEAVRFFDPDDVPRAGGITAAEIADIGQQLRENLTVHYDEHAEYIERILS